MTNAFSTIPVYRRLLKTNPLAIGGQYIEREIARVMVIDDYPDRLNMIIEILRFTFRPEGLGVFYSLTKLPSEILPRDGSLPVFTASEEPGFEQAVQLVRPADLSVIFMDFNIPGKLNGADLTGQIIEKNPDSWIFSISSNPYGVQKIIEAGGKKGLGQNFFFEIPTLFTSVPVLVNP